MLDELGLDDEDIEDDDKVITPSLFGRVVIFPVKPIFVEVSDEIVQFLFGHSSNTFRTST